MDDSQNVYAKYLPTHQGYPLWSPEPSATLPYSYQQDGLQIGDVGIVNPGNGFDVLFNICKPPSHALHKRRGIPTFDPIMLNDEDIYVKSGAVPPGSVISSGVTRILSPSDSSSGAEYEFTPSSPEGAILILPHGATFHDIRNKSQFRDLAIQRALEWYRFATQHFQHEIHNLYLITGFYKARSWSLASFQNAAAGVSGTLALIRVIKEGGNSGNYRWESTFDMRWNDGPRRGGNENVNQSVFLRGFKIAVRKDIFGLWTRPVVEAVPRIQSQRGDRKNNRSSVSLASSSRQSEDFTEVQDQKPSVFNVAQVQKGFAEGPPEAELEPGFQPYRWNTEPSVDNENLKVFPTWRR